jgi:hypothetical protein
MCAIGLAACGGEPRSVKLDVVTATSCLQPYDISCVSALRVKMWGPDRAYRGHCVDLSDAGIDEFGDFSRAEKTLVLEEVRARAEVRIEVRGYRRPDTETPPCDVPGRPDADVHLMFWGASALVDLTAPDLDPASPGNNSVIPVEVECRPKCDCHFIGTSCPTALEHGICGPPVTRLCGERGCSDDLACWDGMGLCQDEVCLPQPDQFCYECASSDACASGVCVRHTVSSPAIDESFCSTSCPPAGPIYVPCPSGTGCRRLGDGFWSRVP